MKISIITVNYNNKKGLARTIESVLQQTFTNIEYIVIDGASTDGSVDIIKENKERITYWVSEKDGGIYDAMNKGILQATGNYCLFLNSGDFFINKDVLTKLFLDVMECEEDILIGRQKFISNSGKISKSPIIKVAELDMQYFISSTLPHQATFIKRDLLFKCGLYNENYRIVADWVFWIEAIVKNKCTVKVIPHYISYMEQGGVSNDMSKCYHEMERYLGDCLADGTLTWTDIFTCSKQSRNYVISNRNKLSSWFFKLLVWFNKYHD